MSRADTLEALVRYEDDYHAWLLQQIALLKAGRFSDVDIQHLLEELRDLGNSETDQIESRLAVLQQHLLKWHFQPEQRSNSWRGTIVEQRKRLKRLLGRSPSLRRHPSRALDDEYETARLKASGETELPLSAFPETCPYSVQQVLDDAFWPGPPGVQA